MSLELNNIRKYYTHLNTKEEIYAIKSIDCKVEDGDFVSIIGPSGSGKTTLLRIISGLEQPSSGKILLEGQQIEEICGQAGLIFQEYALSPWRTVIDNITFGLDFKFVIALHAFRRLPQGFMPERRRHNHYYVEEQNRVANDYTYNG